MVRARVTGKGGGGWALGLEAGWATGCTLSSLSLIFPFKTKQKKRKKRKRRIGKELAHANNILGLTKMR